MSLIAITLGAIFMEGVSHYQPFLKNKIEIEAAKTIMDPLRMAYYGISVGWCIRGLMESKWRRDQQAIEDTKARELAEEKILKACSNESIP